MTEFPTGDDRTELLPGNTPATQRVEMLYAWVATHANGGQGIVAALLPGYGMTPLVTSKHSSAVAMGSVAEHAAALTRGLGPENEVVAVQLVTFRRVEG